MKSKVFLSISYNENIKFSYTVDKFNQRLDVKLAKGVPSEFMSDAISEAYEHYNETHEEEQFIHPQSIVGPEVEKTTYDIYLQINKGKDTTIVAQVVFHADKKDGFYLSQKNGELETELIKTELAATVFFNAMRELPAARMHKPGYGMNVIVIDLEEFMVNPGKTEESLSTATSPVLEFEVRNNINGNYWHCLTPVLING